MPERSPRYVPRGCFEQLSPGIPGRVPESSRGGRCRFRVYPQETRLQYGIDSTAFDGAGALLSLSQHLALVEVPWKNARPATDVPGGSDSERSADSEHPSLHIESTG